MLHVCLQMRRKHYKCGENITNATKTFQMRRKHYKCDEYITDAMKTLQLWWKHYKCDKTLQVWWKHYKCDENITNAMKTLLLRWKYYIWDENITNAMKTLVSFVQSINCCRLHCRVIYLFVFLTFYPTFIIYYYDLNTSFFVNSNKVQRDRFMSCILHVHISAFWSIRVFPDSIGDHVALSGDFCIVFCRRLFAFSSSENCNVVWYTASNYQISIFTLFYGLANITSLYWIYIDTIAW